MKSTLPASHLLRQFLLFVLTTVFLLTLMRAAYGLWQFVKLEETNALVPLFVQGLRFDLSLIGAICLVPVVLGTLLSMLRVTRGLAKFVIVLFLFVGLVLILVLEFLTPWFVHTQGLRPDLGLIGAVESPVDVIKALFADYAIPMAVGAALCLLICIAFWSRLELQRFLRYRLSVPSALVLAILGGILCVVAIWSTPDLRKAPLSLADAQISQDATVNDLAMNTAYKTIYNMLMPVLEPLMPSTNEEPEQNSQ